MMETILRFNVHDGAAAQRISPKMEKSFSNLFFWKGTICKFSEMLRKPEKLQMVEGEQFPNVLVAKLG